MLDQDEKSFGGIHVLQWLFISDRHCYEDAEFLKLNKINFVFPICPEYEIDYRKDISYFKIQWQKDDPDFIFKLQHSMMDNFEAILNEIHANNCSALVFSDQGQNRTICMIVLYLLRRYKWSFYKCLKYINIKRANLTLKTEYFNNLYKVCSEYGQKHQLSCDFGEEMYSPFQEEEILLENTYFNEKLKC